MKLITKYILIVIILVPITAYLDAILIRGMDFQSYLYVCAWEMMILIIGILIGFKLAVKELKPKKGTLDDIKRKIIEELEPKKPINIYGDTE